MHFIAFEHDHIPRKVARSNAEKYKAVRSR
jgi:hypothetical protein